MSLTYETRVLAFVDLLGFSKHVLKSSINAEAMAKVDEIMYALRTIQQGLHQALFRAHVLAAYGSRCALSGLAEARLIDAAHIMPDADERLGQPKISNGICMSKIHHAAYDAGLIGIDPDLRIHVSEHLLALHDGPMLEHGLKGPPGQSNPNTR
jgi:putative restriction endonuclease